MPSVMNQLYSRRGNPADIGPETANPWANYQAPAYADHRRTFWGDSFLGGTILKKVLPIAAGMYGGAAVLPALFGGGGAAAAAGAASSAAPGAAWSMPGVSAPVFGGASAAGAGGAAGTGAAGGAGATSALGRLFSSPGLNLGVNAGLTVAGMIGGNRAAGQARRDQMAQYREGLALQRQQLEAEARNADLDREDARALNAAVNELRRRELDAAEEQRAFDRGLLEQREARLAPYRRASEQALARLNAMWGN